MKYNKMSRHKYSKRSHIHHKRKTVKRGGKSDPCLVIDNKFSILKNVVQNMNVYNIQDVLRDFNRLINEAKRANCLDLAKEINKYFNTIVASRATHLYIQQ